MAQAPRLLRLLWALRIELGGAMLDGGFVWIVAVNRLRRVGVLEDGRQISYEADGRPFSGLTPSPVV
jgi:hypothetical protein